MSDSLSFNTRKRVKDYIDIIDNYICVSEGEGTLYVCLFFFFLWGGGVEGAVF